MELVSALIAHQFPDPVATIAFRHPAILAAAVAVPEAAVNENHGLVSWQYNVRTPRQRFGVKPKSQARPVNQAPDAQFGRSVFAAYSAHHPAPLLFLRSLPIISAHSCHTST